MCSCLGVWLVDSLLTTIMAALMENEIERDNIGDSPSNRYSTVSSRARSFVQKMSPKEEVSSSVSHSSLSSMSLKLIQYKDSYGKAEDSTSPTNDASVRSNYSGASMNPHYSSISLEDRLKMSPPHSIPHRDDDDDDDDDDNLDYNISSPEAKMFEFVKFEDIDSEQKIEFEKLLVKESGCSRSWIHKGLIVNIGFLLVMIVGVILGEVFFPLEGVRGSGVSLRNDTMCSNNPGVCYAVRVVRGIGIFGFLGGITNWIAIEMLFRTIPYMIGTGVFSKKYKEIRESIKKMVVETLFDPASLRLYFTGRKKNIREIFQLGNHFGGLLDSDATSKIIDKKIDSILARPEGFVLTMMGVSHEELRRILKKHINSFIADISPCILDRISSSGLTDGVGIQSEVERILEEKTEDLGSTKIKQLMSLMIRKHLNWLIVWGNLLGALAGVIAEVISIVVARYTDT